MTRIRTTVTIALSVLLMSACGGESPTAPAPFVLSQNVIIGAMYAPRISYQAPRSGRMTLEVSWADPAVNLDLYMTSTGCLELHPIANCGIIERSISTTGTREQVSRGVLEGENLTFYVDNRSNVNQAADVRFAIE